MKVEGKTRQLCHARVCSCLSILTQHDRTFFPDADGRVIRLEQGEFLLHPVSLSARASSSSLPFSDLTIFFCE